MWEIANVIDPINDTTFRSSYFSHGGIEILTIVTFAIFHNILDNWLLCNAILKSSSKWSGCNVHVVYHFQTPTWWYHQLNPFLYLLIHMYIERNPLNLKKPTPIVINICYHPPNAIENKAPCSSMLVVVRMMQDISLSRPIMHKTFYGCIITNKTKMWRIQPTFFELFQLEHMPHY